MISFAEYNYSKSRMYQMLKLGLKELSKIGLPNNQRLPLHLLIKLKKFLIKKDKGLRIP